MQITELAQKKINTMYEYIKQGKKVKMLGREVKSMEIVRTRRSKMVNVEFTNGEVMAFYLPDFLRRKVDIE